MVCKSGRRAAPTASTFCNNEKLNTIPTDTDIKITKVMIGFCCIIILTNHN
jgi:hypothetical protein